LEVCIVKKIEKLTQDQERRLVEFRTEWFRTGIRTDRADRAKAETAILAMRGEIGQQKAPIFVWCDSPATSLLAIHVLKSPELAKGLRASLRDSLWASLRDSLRDSLRASLWDSLGDSLRDSLWDSLGASLRDSLWASLRDSLWDSLWDSLRASLRDSLGDSLGDSLRASLGASLRASLWASLRDSLWDSLGDSLGDSLRASLWDSLRASLRDSLRASLRDSLGNAWWGQHESYWIAFYLFCRDIIGIQYDEHRSRQLDMWRDIAQSCCWWWCYENYVIVSERPTVVGMDDAGRIHGATGPAIAFADGWQVHAWHGTRVPKEWIEKTGSLPVSSALTWPNIEQRRAAAELLGWKRVLSELSPRVIDRDIDPVIGELLEIDLPEAAQSRFLRVLCGTGREFVLPVPREMRTALQANAWTYRLEDTPQILRQMEVRT
jgi:hypothetical protein